MSKKEMNDIMTTGSSAKDGVSDKLMKAAEAHAEQRIEELSYDHSKRKKALIKFGAMGVFTAIIVFFATIAWFTMNKEVESEGMSIKTATMPFDIATRGAHIRNEALMNEKHPEYVEGTSAEFTDGRTYYSGDSLLLRYDTSDTEIGPGGSGELSLFVIPKTDDAMSVNVSINVVAFAEIEKKDGSGNIIYKTNGSGAVTEEPETEIIEIKSAADFTAKANAVNNSTAADAAADYVRAADYLKGHILFFGGIGDVSSGTAVGNRYYYTTPYTEREFTQSIPAGSKGTAVKVPVYWMWTNTLSQVALADNVSGQRNGYPILADSDTEGKADITDYLKTNKDSVFANSSGSTVGYIDAVTAVYANAAAFNSSAAAAFEQLSNGYNQADFDIGTMISYFMIEVSVGSGNG